MDIALPVNGPYNWTSSRNLHSTVYRPGVEVVMFGELNYHTLSETTKQYDCGVQLQEFVKRLPVNSSNTTNTEPFTFEPFHTTRENESRKTSTQSIGSASSGPHSQEGSPQLASPRKDRYRAPVKAWSPGLVMGSDTDSASGSSKSVDSYLLVAVPTPNSQIFTVTVEAMDYKLDSWRNKQKLGYTKCTPSSNVPCM
ncbi:uncharacterized protein [Argopecten irradians]|uniref:uncharacterized protein n=1 Tax=Argopecten irradians TaxID=31199 RepID=UPI003718C8A8